MVGSKKMREFKKSVLFDAKSIAERVKELGKEISMNHPQGDLLLIGILKGSFVFLADLARNLDVSCEIDFAKISSYGSGTVSSGQLNVILDAGAEIKDRDVILVDDIVDSGLTLSEYRSYLEKKGPRSLKTAAMINKTGRREKHVQLDYCGFDVEDGFLVGYGLDCDECYRYLPSIYVLEEE
jgi:hypoxanthine phosphoribosyltransferase